MSDPNPPALTGAQPAPLRIGAVGYQHARGVFLRPLTDSSDVQVTALFDPDSTRGRALARELARPSLFMDYSRFLAEAPMDALLIAAPDGVRARHILAACEARKHVLCYPGMALDLTGAIAVADAASRSDMRVVPAFLLRFERPFRVVEQQIRPGDLGPIRRVRCEWGFDRRDVSGGEALALWRRHFEAAAQHSVDLCRWRLGEVVTVSAQIDVPDSSAAGEPRADLILNHVTGAVSVHHFASGRRSSAHRFEVEGEQSALEISVQAAADPLAFQTVSLTLRRHGCPAERVDSPEHPEESASAAERLLGHFARCARGEERPLVSPQDSCRAIEALYAAYLSTIDSVKMSLPLTSIPNIDAILRRASIRGGNAALEAGPDED